MATVKWVIAGTFDQANLYAKQNRQDGVVYKFVSRPDMIRGFVNPHGVFIGTWKDRDDILEILDILNSSSSEHNPVLSKIRGEMWQKASNKQIYSVAASSGQKDTFDALNALIKINSYTNTTPVYSIADVIKVNGI
jgi:hypothetical protein